MIKPLIHLNGTSREMLLDDLLSARAHLRTALSVLGDTAPNARDYYPLGASAYPLARLEHEDRLSKVREVLNEIEALVQHCAGE